jgi:hypothetical protein
MASATDEAGANDDASQASVSAALARPQQARKAHRAAGRELAWLVRCLHGGGAVG